MFRGISEVTIDAKGRLSLPVRFRAAVLAENGGVMVATIDTQERCLLLYRLKEWEAIEQKLSALPSFDASARRIQRLLIGHATECEIDAQGRLLLAAPLREYAHLERDILLVGQGQKFEVWSATLWQEKRQQWLSEEIQALPEEMKHLSL